MVFVFSIILLVWACSSLCIIIDKTDKTRRDTRSEEVVMKLKAGLTIEQQNKFVKYVLELKDRKFNTEDELFERLRLLRKKAMFNEHI